MLSEKWFVCSKCGKKPPEVRDFHVGDSVVCFFCQPPGPVTVIAGSLFMGQREWTGDSVLDALKSNSIFEIKELVPGIRYAIFERCDQYFYVELDRFQLRRLADEIREIAKS